MQIQHVFREGNKATVFIAVVAARMEHAMQTLSPPPGLHHILWEDRGGESLVLGVLEVRGDFSPSTPMTLFYLLWGPLKKIST